MMLTRLGERSADLLGRALELRLWKEAQANSLKEEAPDTIAGAAELTLQGQGGAPAQ